MRKRTYEMIGLAILMALPIVAAGGLYAGEVTNSETGSHSTNNTSVVVKNVAEVEVVNAANISNITQLDTSTGTNIASNNAGTGSVVSGDIGGSLGVKSEVNQSNLILPETTNNAKIAYSVENNNTGVDTTNTASFGSINRYSSYVSNTMNVDNRLVADMSTGGNTANGNTGDGSVRSGNVRFAVSFETIGNFVNIAFGKGGGVPDPGPDGKGGGPGDEPLLLASADPQVLPTRLPTAGAGDLFLMLLSAAIGTVFVVELLDRKGSVPI